jgi:hypothetical protein
MNEPTEIGNCDEADSLQRVLTAINRQVDQQEPSDQILTDTLAKMRQAADARPTSTKNFLFRITTMTLPQKIAAAVALTLGGLTLWLVFSVFGGFGNITYAEVAQQIRAAHTMSWIDTVSGGRMAQPMTMKTLCMEPGHVRMEMPNGMGEMIMDKTTGKTLILTAAVKTAQVFEVKNPGAEPNPTEDPEAYFRNLAEQHGEPIEDRQIGDIKAKGFRIESLGYPTTLWVDPTTKLPLIVESTVTMGQQQMKVVMTNFVFDAPMDESLFSLQPPPGYRVTRMPPMTVVVDVERNAITLLRYYSARSGGTFPASLTDIGELSRFIGQRDAGKDGELDADSENAAAASGGLMVTLGRLKQGTDYDYTPQGVKLGESNKRIFWYYKKDAQVYRAIYGDLHAADIAAADLPIKK